MSAKSDEEIADMAARFPKGTVIGILEKCPELTEQSRFSMSYLIQKNVADWKYYLQLVILQRGLPKRAT